MVAELSLITGYPLRRAFALLLLVLSSMSFCDAQGNTPHILLIAADDLAYTDISSYGGEIDTPHLDELATNGIRFTQFHTAPYCAVTRAMVLTGNNNHVAGMGSQDLSTTVKGYEGQLSNRVVTIPQLLKTKGYSTFMAGKWHLGTSPQANPHEEGLRPFLCNARRGCQPLQQCRRTERTRYITLHRRWDKSPMAKR
jgi:arylsulfatase A-like enzyme